MRYQGGGDGSVWSVLGNRCRRRNVIDLVTFANGATMLVGPRSIDAFSAWRVRLCLRAAKAALFP